MMKFVIAAAAVLSLSTAAAYAGEGNGEPFPPPNIGRVIHTDGTKATMSMDAPFNYYNANTPTTLSNYQQAPGSAQDPYPFRMTGRSIPLPGQVPAAVATSPAQSNHG